MSGYRIYLPDWQKARSNLNLEQSRYSPRSGSKQKTFPSFSFLFLNPDSDTRSTLNKDPNPDSQPCRSLFKHNFFFKLFFTQAETPHMLRFDLWYTVIFPGPVQVTVGGAGFEPGTAASSVWCRPVALSNWATTSPKINLQTFNNKTKGI
jgi:hypothetical protein